MQICQGIGIDIRSLERKKKEGKRGLISATFIIYLSYTMHNLDTVKKHPKAKMDLFKASSISAILSYEGFV